VKSKREFICGHVTSGPTDHKNAGSAHSPITSLETTYDVPLHRVLLEKLKVTDVVKQLSVIYGN
jgi:hypothetical protein